MKAINVSTKVFVIGFMGVLCLFSDPTEVGREWDWTAQIVGVVIIAVAYAIHYFETHPERR